jgi:prepilin-type N-terminal cleavage/methylation domain-containing protein
MITSNKGLTIIELVVVIVVLGLAIPPLLTMWANVAWRSAASELLADSAFFAQQLMEEIKSKDFVDPDDPNNTNLGLNSGESSNDRTTFDDVDDFAGCTDASVTTPDTGYTRSATVAYVNLSGSTWQLSGSATDYKRIVVTVSRVGGSAIPVSLTAMVSSH